MMIEFAFFGISVTTLCVSRPVSAEPVGRSVRPVVRPVRHHYHRVGAYPAPPPPARAMNVIAEIQRINQAELENGSVGTSASWHAKYADTAWVFVGNLPMQLTEGDVICVMSQFGEVSALCFLVCIYI